MDVHRFSSGVEILAVTDAGRRRRWSDGEKARIVAESFSGPREVSATARRHGVSRSLLTRWRADYRASRLGTAAPAFMAVTMAADTPPLPAPVLAAPTSRAVMPAMADATIDVVLRNGRRMIVPVSIDPVVLARLLPIVDAS
ncbi:IS66-like element accessory protein TnpA [Neoaquamicrobium sediminum]